MKTTAAIRIRITPKIPPRNTTQSLGLNPPPSGCLVLINANAAKIESTANAMSVNSITSTVGQNFAYLIFFA